MRHLTQSNGGDVQVKDIPLDRVMVETDAPYLGFPGCREGYAKPKQQVHANFAFRNSFDALVKCTCTLSNYYIYFPALKSSTLYPRLLSTLVLLRALVVTNRIQMYHLPCPRWYMRLPRRWAHPTKTSHDGLPPTVVHFSKCRRRQRGFYMHYMHSCSLGFCKYESCGHKFSHQGLPRSLHAYALYKPFLLHVTILRKMRGVRSNVSFTVPPLSRSHRARLL